MKVNETEFPASLDYLINTLSKISKSSIKNIQCLPVKGDASDREYFRLKLDVSGKNISSVILMKVMNAPIKKDNPFVTTQSFLEKCSINVPKLYFMDMAKGFIFLEDLGDITLEEKIKTSSLEEQEQYYKKAIDVLLNMQAKCTERLNENIPAFHLAFDQAKLLWELDFMVAHFIEGFLGKTVSEKDRQILHDAFVKICTKLSEQKRYFCHRDYHSRNIMIRNDELILLDFQDARTGPCQYDLASLLRDSYFTISPNLYKKLIMFCIDNKEAKEGHSVNREEFIKVLDWMSIQRNLKALGTFGYQVNTKKNERYRDAMPRTIQYVFENLGKYSELESLKRCLVILYS